MSSLIQLKDINKYYGEGKEKLHVLKSLNMEIEQGEFLMIMGKSGSGKTTLMNSLGFLDRFDDGVYLFNNEEVTHIDENKKSELRNKYMGFIFQQFNLLPVLTAKENIIMPLLLDKQKPDEAYLKQLTELLGIQGRLEHLPHELSGGQQQRVAIARALIAKPDVIFADEPTGNLDSKSGGEVMELLQNVWKKMGKALVVITHDSRIARMADRQFQIVDGVLTEVTAK